MPLPQLKPISNHLSSPEQNPSPDKKDVEGDTWLVTLALCHGPLFPLDLWHTGVQRELPLYLRATWSLPFSSFSSPGSLMKSPIFSLYSNIFSLVFIKTPSSTENSIRNSARFFNNMKLFFSIHIISTILRNRFFPLYSGGTAWAPMNVATISILRSFVKLFYTSPSTFTPVFKTRP
jgi:hypothetical protein